MNRLFSIRLLSCLCYSGILFLLGCAKIHTIQSNNPVRDDGEYWELLTFEDRPIGYQHNTWSREIVQGKTVRRFEHESRMRVLRHGNEFDVAMKIDCLSDEKGYFFSSQSILEGAGQEALKSACRVENGQLIVLDAMGKQIKRIPKFEDVAGPDAVQRSLADQPMQPGERRHILAFDPPQCRIIENELHAEKLERVENGGLSNNLLRIAIRIALRNESWTDLQDNQPTVSSTEPADALSEQQSSRHSSTTLSEGVLWVDGQGNIFKSRISFNGDRAITSLRVEKDIALAVVDKKLPRTELGQLGVVALDQAIPVARARSEIAFVVRIRTGSPLDRFPNTPFQTVIPLDDRTAKIVVYSAVGPEADHVLSPAFAKLRGSNVRSEARPEDLASSMLINSDDPELKKLATQIDSSALTPWQTALALEKLVHETILQTNFSTAFASSTDVLKTKSGDCTEFAVLLAALCRAKGIPARVSLGLVYSPLTDLSTMENQTPQQNNRASAIMAFHLWNEVLIDGVWRPLDATLAIGGADAARIKIADESLKEDTPMLLVRSILGLIGQLEINVAER